MHAYDVIVVGGRVAGASLALLLGERGHRVLLIDRDGFPSDTLSTHYLRPEFVPLLAQLGVLGDVEAAGFRHVTRARTYLEDCVIEGPSAPSGAYGLTPRRDVLDACLAEHAVKRGQVEFHDRTVAEGLLRDGDRVVGVVLRSGGERIEARAKVVVGADGKHSRVAEWVSAAKYHEVPGVRPVFYGYFRGLRPLDEPALEIFFQRNVAGLIFPMRPDEDCLALELQPEHWDNFRANPRDAFLAWFRSLPGMAARLADARIEGKILGCRGVDNYFRQPSGPGWVLTGDAAYCKDPLLGLGLNDAISQAFWLADALHATLNGADWDQTLAAYHQRRDDAVMPGYRAVVNFTRVVDASPEAMAWLRALCAIPGFVRALAPGLPITLANAETFPAATFPHLAKLAQGFGARPD
jgi:2-polyprenyl-6-methoxyphenol hydroxylase-like FAD-dependent oxidoreductase